MNRSTDLQTGIRFMEIFDIQKMEKLQDLFAEAHGVASIITDPEGNHLTSPSNYTRFCSEVIRGTEIGCSNCQKSKAFTTENHTGSLIIRKCVGAGLWNACAGITVNGQHLANWVIGQVRSYDTDSQDLIEYAKQIGTNVNDFMEAFNEVPVMSAAQFKKTAKMLYAFVGELSEQGLLNWQLKQQAVKHEQLIEELKSSQEQYRLISENIGETVALLDFNLNFIYLSPSVVNLLGYTPQEMFALQPANVIPSYSFRRLLQSLQQEILLKGIEKADPTRKRKIECPMIRKNGEIIQVESTVSIVQGSSGNYQEILVVSRDITRRTEKDKELKANEEKYRDLFENVQDVFYKVNSNGIIEEVSPSVKHYSEYCHEEIVGKPAREFYSDSVDRDQFMELLHQNGEVRDYEITLKTKNGKLKYGSVNAMLVAGKGRESNSIFGAIRDITKRKLAEKELLETNNRLLHIFNSMPILLNAFDESNRIIFWNKACEQTTGYGAEEVIGHPKAIEWLYPDADYREKVWKSSLNPDNKDNVYNLTAKNGEIKTVEWFDVHHHISIPGWSSWGFGLEITERKNAENLLNIAKEKAEESEHLLLAFINAIPDIVCYKDGQGRWLLANDADLEMFNLKGVDYKGKTDLELAEYTHGLYKDAFRNCMISDESAWEKGIMSEGIEIIPTVTGETKVLDVLKIPEFYPDGSRKGLAVIGRDISELYDAQYKLKKAYYELKEKESRLKLATSSGKLGIWEWLIPANKIVLDKRMLELHGIDSESFAEHIDRWINSIHPEDKQSVIDSINAALEGNNSFSALYRVIHPSGKILYLKANGQIIRNDHRKPDRMIGITRNVTKTKLFERDLIKAKEKAEQDQRRLIRQNEQISLNNERLESLLRISDSQSSSIQQLLDFALEEAIKLTGSKIGYIYFYNESTQKFTLNTWSKEVMERCQVLLPQTTYDLDQTGLWGEAVRQRKPILTNNYQAETRFTKGTPQGHVMLTRFLTIPVFSDGEIVAVAGIANKETDYDQSDIRQLTLLMDSVWKITERVSLIENLHVAKQRAEESDRLKSAFLANMSHEIRTPLNSIIGFSGLLADDDYDSEQKAEFVGHIITNGNNLLNIISDIVDFSKIEAGEITLRIRNVPALQLISEAVSVHQLKIAEKGLFFQQNTGEISESHVIIADPERVHQIFNNLISNSLKFTEKGFIELGAFPSGQSVTFYVKDSGIGISPEFHGKIFDRFQQVDLSYSRKFGGNGLGLAITKNLVELMGGRIWVESDLEKGSTFLFSLPLTDQ